MFLVLGFMGSDSGLYTRLLVTSRLHCQGASFLFEQSPALHIMDSKSGGFCWVRDYALRVFAVQKFGLRVQEEQQQQC